MSVEWSETHREDTKQKSHTCTVRKFVAPSSWFSSGLSCEVIRKLEEFWRHKVGSFFASVENPGTSFLMLFCLGGEVISRNIFEGFLN